MENHPVPLSRFISENKWYLLGLTVLALLPIGKILLGVDLIPGRFNSPMLPGLIALLFAWASFAVSASTFLLSLLHHRASRDRSVLVFSVAIGATAIMDFGEAVGVIGLVGASGELEAGQFLQTLPLGHLSTFLFVIAGFSWIVLPLKRTTRYAVSVSVASLAGATAVLYFCSLMGIISVVPKAANDYGFVAVLPLILVSIIGPALTYILLARHQSPLHRSFVLAMIPVIVMEAHLAFGTRAIFDSHYLAAGFLQVVVYLTVAAGLAFDYLLVQDKARRLAEAQVNQARLVEKARDLEAANSRLATEIEMRSIIQRELVVAREQAERASRAKTEFLTNMSHEIRTPLNAIIGMADLLAETPLGDEQEKYVRICRRAGRTLLTIVTDVLDLSKIEAGQLAIEKIEFDILRLIESVFEVMEVRALEKNLRMHLEVSSLVPQLVRGDSNRLRQILLNLVGNAVKFTKEGEVTLKAEWKHSTSTSGEIVFIVSDTGIGIPSGQIENIFENFTQADSSVTRKHGGTGLGLAITKRLSEAMGGRVKVQSTEGFGSLFTVSVPLEVPQKMRILKSRDQFFDLQGKKILVVAESVSARGVLTNLLCGWGADVVPVAEVPEAQTIVSEDSGRPYDLVIVEPSEPGSIRQKRFDGILSQAATRDAKTISIGRAKFPVEFEIDPQLNREQIMDVVGRALSLAIPQQMSMDWLITPPIDEPPKPLETEAKTNPQKRTKTRLLLVEDSPDNQAIVMAYLRNADIDLTVAHNGREACEKFKSNEFDLVFMDMQMPVLDGYSATREIREFEREAGRSRTPIVALTAHALTDEIKRSLDSGCDCHLAKPVRKQQLLEAITTFTMVPREPSETGHKSTKIKDDLVIEKNFATLPT